VKVRKVLKSKTDLKGHSSHWHWCYSTGHKWFSTSFFISYYVFILYLLWDIISYFRKKL